MEVFQEEHSRQAGESQCENQQGQKNDGQRLKPEEVLLAAVVTLCAALGGPLKLWAGLTGQAFCQKAARKSVRRLYICWDTDDSIALVIQLGPMFREDQG